MTSESNVIITKADIGDHSRFWWSCLWPLIYCY